MTSYVIAVKRQVLFSNDRHIFPLSSFVFRRLAAFGRHFGKKIDSFVFVFVNFFGSTVLQASAIDNAPRHKECGELAVGCGSVQSETSIEIIH